MRQIHVYLPEPLIKGLDELVRAKLYPNRAEAIRFAILDLLKKEGKFTIRKT